MTNKPIGISLSRCVADIARGKVNYDDVEKIVAATMASDAHWQELLTGYAKTRWAGWDSFTPDEACAIAQRLKDEDKIEQPRLTGGTDHFPINGQDGTIWLASEGDIIWNDADELV